MAKQPRPPSLPTAHTWFTPPLAVLQRGPALIAVDLRGKSPYAITPYLVEIIERLDQEGQRTSAAVLRDIGKGLHRARGEYIPMDDSEPEEIRLRLSQACRAHIVLAGPITQADIDRLILILQTMRDAYPKERLDQEGK